MDNEAPIVLGTGLLFSAIITYLIYHFRPRLVKFPKGRKTGPMFYKWTSPRTPAAMAYSPLTGIKQCPFPSFRARSAWFLYALHQICAWVCIYLQQLYLSKTPFAFNEGVCNPLKDGTMCGYKNSLHWTHWLALSCHAFFIVLHLVQTHLWYDGIALDMGEGTSQISVVFMLVFVLFMENRERGIFMNQHLPVSEVIQNFALKYHGYFFSWSTIYTFWYHPCEGTSGHLMGFFYTYMILLQGSLAFTRVHLWSWWRVSIETFVAFHAAAVAYFVQLHKTMWRMFLFGFWFIFVGTQMWGPGLFPQNMQTVSRSVFGVLYVAIVATAYWSDNSINAKSLSEIIRVPSLEYLLIFVAWLVCVGSCGFAGLVVQDDPAKGGIGAAVAVAVMVLSFVSLTWGMSEVSEMVFRKMGRTMEAQAMLDRVEAGEGEAENVNVNDKVFTKADVEKHQTRGDCWIVVDGQVLDVTNWLSRHPGGAAVLLQRAGKDCSKDFHAAEHSEHTRNTLLYTLRVGVAKDAHGPIATTSCTTTATKENMNTVLLESQRP